MRIKPDVKMTRKARKRFKKDYAVKEKANEKARRKLAEVRKDIGEKS